MEKELVNEEKEDTVCVHSLNNKEVEKCNTAKQIADLEEIEEITIEAEYNLSIEKDTLTKQVENSNKSQPTCIRS